VIPMSRRLKPLLETFFVLNDKFPWTARTIQRAMKRIANKAGITKTLTPHVLRHTFSILWIHKGGSTRALQGILGHDHLSTTEIYLNMSPEQLGRRSAITGRLSESGQAVPKISSQR